MTRAHEATEILAAAGIHNARREAAWLAEGATDETSLLELARRRAAGEPLQYLTGIAGFRHLDLSVRPGVFIPRPETELLVECALAHLPRGSTAIDVGTGSGAIALSMKQERADATVHATEIDNDAMQQAVANRDHLGLDVAIVSGDLFSGLPTKIEGAVDVVVSNPPYVATTEQNALPVDVVGHEPHIALFAGERGLDVIDRLIDEAGRWLRPDGWLVVEIGEGQSDDVMALATRTGYVDIAIHDDLAGRPRYVDARYVG